MTANAIESGVGIVNVGKQSALGTKALATGTGVGFNRLKLFDGSLKPGTTDGSEEYVDGNRFSSPSTYVDQTGGDVGSFTHQAQPENATMFWAHFMGADSVTGSADPYTHTVTSAAAAGAWITWWQKVGVSIVVRQAYSDSRTAKIMQVCGDKQKPMHQVLSVMSLNPAEVFETDPAKTETATDPFYWPETEGAVIFDGVTLSEVNEEILEADAATKPFYGNSISAAALIDGKGSIIRTLKAIVTNNTVPLFNKAIYGEEAPAAGTKPSKAVYHAAVKTKYTKSATRTLTITTPNVEVKPDEMSIAPQREGGETPIEFGGQCLKEGATAALTIIGLTPDATAY